MQILIQAHDYTSALDSAHPLTIRRALNEPSICELWLTLPPNSSLATPQRNQSLTIAGDDGRVYFTGYLAATPMPQYAGLATEGPRYRLALRAISDEILLDQLPLPPSKGSSGATAGQLVQNLVTHTGSSTLTTSGLTLGSTVSHFVPAPGASFSAAAAQVAAQARASYRAHSGALSLNQLPAAIHPLNEDDGTLSLSNLTLTTAARRVLANDITVCGEEEPWAYVTEYFLGDGTTTEFYLAEPPYSATATLIYELFNEPQINASQWSDGGAAAYFTLGANGLTFLGGNGIDGQAQLSWIDPVEIGGTLLLEAAGLSLANASTGILAGLFTDIPSASGCIAGFHATAANGTGAVTLQPLVFGAATGTPYPINPANQYTLRLRLHAPEHERLAAFYYSYGDSGAISTGGTGRLSPANLLFEVVEIVNGVAASPVVLFDGSVANTPATCNVVAASSLNLHGSLRSLTLSQLGSGWVVSTPSGGAAYTRPIGSSTQGAECHVESTGRLAFYTGFVPLLNEQIAVTYRTKGRAVGRAVNATSQSQLSAAGLPAVSAWIGSVTNPPTRSSADCRAAASALAQAAASAAALWTGTYKGTQFDFAADVWPGDALALTATSLSLNTQVIIRTVTLSYTATTPDLVAYEVAFANDWADDLAIKTSATVPTETWLPAPVPYTPIANLTKLTVTSITATTVTVNTGTAPPSGGGFEVRLRDWAFQPGEDSTLLLRGSQQNLTFPRFSSSDRYYIRMYDGNTPPNYSEFSTALFFNLPLTT